MNLVLGLALVVVAPPPGLNRQDAAWLWQGRASEVQRAKKRADYCGIKNAEVAIVRGPAFFHNPEELGAELSIPAKEMTSAVKACMSRLRATASRRK